MRLYQHSARCPVALRSFLDCNPDYWCFIPLTLNDAVVENMAHFRSRPTTVLSLSSPSSSATAAPAPATTTYEIDPELDNIVAMGAIDNHRVTHYLLHLPQPPASYAFSYPQRKKQGLFFEQCLSLPINQPSYSPLDLYQVKIIAVRK